MVEDWPRRRWHVFMLTMQPPSSEESFTKVDATLALDKLYRRKINGFSFGG
jgi:hypothetical protein